MCSGTKLFCAYPSMEDFALFVLECRHTEECQRKCIESTILVVVLYKPVNINIHWTYYELCLSFEEIYKLIWT